MPEADAFCEKECIIWYQQYWRTEESKIFTYALDIGIRSLIEYGVNQNPSGVAVMYMRVAFHNVPNSPIPVFLRQNGFFEKHARHLGDNAVGLPDKTVGARLYAGVAIVHIWSPERNIVGPKPVPPFECKSATVLEYYFSNRRIDWWSRLDHRYLKRICTTWG